MLHGRPFLVINTIFRPKKIKLTKGWTKDKKNWDILENPIVVDKVTPKMLTDASVIIDLLGNTVIKNRNEMADLMTINLYSSRYKDICEEGIAAWTIKYAKENLEEDLKTKTQRLIDMAKYKK